MNVDYNELVENGIIERLKDRRTAATLRFALKAEASPRFGKKRFRETRSTEIVPRVSTRRPYQETRYRAERNRNNPLQALTRALNEHYTGT